ncbi:hypothetical protein FJT64_009271 [Amphibalanus amphitrite]|uniref:CCHC-type domain-containing protein n=1 Tax=Amphibalanus amphitrite TaxID=1232801 RepID=A0A6A4V948_AMPAM|nr:hypothetical protein FJT64_009271 [Amphibalanus amphitrite]
MNSTGLSMPAVEPFRQGDDFGRWLRGVERYLCAVGIQEADRKCAVLLHLVGPDVADLSETLPEETSETADSFERLKGKLMAYLSPVRNAVAERSLFHGMQMEPEEDLERFLGRLRAQVVRCGYAATEVDRELRDRCVLGSRAGLRAKLVKLAASKGDGLTLAEVRQTARAHRDMEQLGAQLGGTRLAEAPAADAEGAVNAVRSPQSRLGTCFRCGAAGHWQRNCPAAGAVPRARDSRCPAGQAASGGRSGAAGEHGRGAPGNSGSDGGPRQRRCFKCGSTEHLKAACPQRRVRLVAAEKEQTDGDGDAWLVSSVGGDAWLVNSVEASAAEPEMKTVTVNGQQLTMVVDTGSPVSLVSAETARQRGLLQLLDPCDLRLTSFTGQVIPLRGEVRVSVTASGRPATRLRLVVTGLGPHRPLMGREWLQALGLMTSTARVRRVQPARTLDGVPERHSAVFNEELGRIPIKEGLRLKSDAKPVYRRARPVPLALRDAGGGIGRRDTGGSKERRGDSGRRDAEETERSSRQTAAETEEPTEETELSSRQTAAETEKAEEMGRRTEEPVPSCQQTEAEVSRQTTGESDGPSGRTAVEASTDDGGAGAIGPTVDGRGELAGGGGAGTGEPAGGGGATAGEPDLNGLASEAEAGPTGRAGSPRRRAQPGTPRRSTRGGSARSRKCLCGGV